MSIKALLDETLIAIREPIKRLYRESTLVKKGLSKYVQFLHVSFSISALHFQRVEKKFISDKMHLEPSLYA